MKKIWVVSLLRLLDLIWIALGIVRGYGDFFAGYSFLCPTDIDYSRYKEPTVSAEEVDRMRNGVRAMVDCSLGTLLLLTAVARFIRRLTTSSHQTGREPDAAEQPATRPLSK